MINNKKDDTFFPTYLDYKMSGDVPLLRVFGRDIHDNRIIKQISRCEPYFYILESERNKIPNDSSVSKIEFAPPTINGEKTLKLTVPNPMNIIGKKEEMEYLVNYFDYTYEADVKFVDRMRLDLKLNSHIRTPKNKIITPNQIEHVDVVEKLNLRVHISDFENDDSHSIDEAKKGLSEIYSFVIWDSYSDIYHIFTHLKMNDMMKMMVTKELREYWQDHEKYSHMKDSSLEFHLSDNECEMLKDYIQFNAQNSPDIIAGFNYIDYDNNLLFERFKTLESQGLMEVNTHKRLSEVGEVRNSYWHFGIKRGTTYEITGVNILDIEHLYESLQSSTLMWTSLNFAAEKELNAKKLPRTSTKEMSQTNVPHLIAYNIVDVQLTKLLNEKKQLINIYIEMDTSSYCKIGELSKSVMIDRLLLNKVHGRYVLPSKNSIKEIDRSNFIGGIVLEPTAGLHRNVGVIDFKGLYSTLIRSINISIENKHPEGEYIAANGVRFKSSPIGIIPEILNKLANERDEFKILRDNATIDEEYNVYDVKQNNRKILGNSMYGNLGFKGFRMIDIDTAIAITSSGQFVNLSVKAYLESLGYKIIYGDTDSIFLLCDESLTFKEIETEILTLTKKINIKLDEIMLTNFNIKDHCIEIEPDGIFKTLFQVLTKKGVAGKKRYAGLKYNDKGETYFVVKGFQTVKADSSQITKDIQKKLIQLILDETPHSEIRDYMLDVKEKFYNTEYPTQYYSKRYNLNKSLEDSVNSQGKRACINSNQKNILNRNYKKNDQVLIYFVESAASNIQEIALDYDEELPSQFSINHEISWEKYIVNPLKTILEAYSLTWNYITTGLEVKDLSNFVTLTPQKQTTIGAITTQPKTVSTPTKPTLKPLLDFFKK